MKIAKSGIDRIVSSKSSVKSKPPRQVPANGPNESSIEGGHDENSFMPAITVRWFRSGQIEY